MLACGGGTPLQYGEGGWFGHAGRTPRVNGEKAGAEPERSLARRRQDNKGQLN